MRSLQGDIRFGCNRRSLGCICDPVVSHTHGAPPMTVAASAGPMKRHLTEVTVRGWAGVEDKTRVTLGPRRTVLVGRNGVGKSVLMSAIDTGASVAAYAE